MRIACCADLVLENSARSAERHAIHTWRLFDEVDANPELSGSFHSGVDQRGGLRPAGQAGGCGQDPGGHKHDLRGHALAYDHTRPFQYTDLDAHTEAYGDAQRAIFADHAADGAGGAERHDVSHG